MERPHVHEVHPTTFTPTPTDLVVLKSWNKLQLYDDVVLMHLARVRAFEIPSELISLLEPHQQQAALYVPPMAS